MEGIFVLAVSAAAATFGWLIDNLGSIVFVGVVIFFAYNVVKMLEKASKHRENVDAQISEILKYVKQGRSERYGLRHTGYPDPTMQSTLQSIAPILSNPMDTYDDLEVDVARKLFKEGSFETKMAIFDAWLDLEHKFELRDLIRTDRDWRVKARYLRAYEYLGLSEKETTELCENIDDLMLKALAKRINLACLAREIGDVSEARPIIKTYTKARTTLKKVEILKTLMPFDEEHSKLLRREYLRLVRKPELVLEDRKILAAILNDKYRLSYLIKSSHLSYKDPETQFHETLLKGVERLHYKLWASEFSEFIVQYCESQIDLVKTLKRHQSEDEEDYNDWLIRSFFRRDDIVDRLNEGNYEYDKLFLASVLSLAPSKTSEFLEEKFPSVPWQTIAADKQSERLIEAIRKQDESKKAS